MAQHEYGVALSQASTPEDMGFVSIAFEAGISKERQRVLSIIRNSMVVGQDISTIIKEIEDGGADA